MNKPVAISVRANPEADCVVYTFGDESFGLPVEDAAILVNHTLAAIEALRPLTARPQGGMSPDIVQ